MGKVQTAPAIMGADLIAFLRYRITALLATTPPAQGRRLGLILLAPLVAALTIGSVAMQHRGEWSHDRLMLSTIVNLERLQPSFGY